MTCGTSILYSNIFILFLTLWLTSLTSVKTIFLIFLQLGRVYYDSLPPFMKDNLENVFFKLFAHQQLSVREIAGKGFSSFLYKMEHKVWVSLFE